MNLPLSRGKVVRYGRPLLTFNGLYTPFSSPVIGGQKPLKGRNKNLSLLALSPSP